MIKHFANYIIGMVSISIHPYLFKALKTYIFREISGASLLTVLSIKRWGTESVSQAVGVLTPH